MSISYENIHTNLDAALSGVSLDRTRKASLQLQLTDVLRDLILAGTAKPGDRLPSSRILADELSVSRATVVLALEQLASEGYLVGRQGAGTFVAPDIPHLSTPKNRSSVPTPIDGSEDIIPFHPGVPDIRLFPYVQWAKYLEAAWRRPDPNLLRLPDPCGWLPLRRAIADHIAAWRQVECLPDQVVITAGGSHAFQLIAALLGSDRPVAIESPIYPVMQQCFEAASLECIAIPVDKDGLDPQLLPGRASGVVVTPSRQFPLGMTMPVARRLALLDWAERQNALIIEDDYDSEFRFQGQPLPALASLDGLERTVYMGSFSKLLSASMRLGYLVFPQRMVPEVRKLAARSPVQPSLTPQPALARFMEEGEFARHIRKMRRVYAKRHARLHELLAKHLDGYLIPVHQPTGMHIYCRPGPKLQGCSDQAVADIGAAMGLYLRPLSAYAQTAPVREGLVLGFAAFDEDELECAVVRLAGALSVLKA